METPNEEKKIIEESSEIKSGEAPRKKKNIIRVYHAQNASDGGRKRPQGEKRPVRPGAPGQRPAGAPGPRPAGAPGTRPAGARPAAPGERRPVRPAGAEGEARPAGERVRPGTRPAAGVRPAAPVKAPVGEEKPKVRPAAEQAAAAKTVEIPAAVQEAKAAASAAVQGAKAAAPAAAPETKAAAPVAASEPKAAAPAAKAPAPEAKAAAPETKAPATESKPASSEPKAEVRKEAPETKAAASADTKPEPAAKAPAAEKPAPAAAPKTEKPETDKPAEKAAAPAAKPAQDVKETKEAKPAAEPAKPAADAKPEASSKDKPAQPAKTSKDTDAAGKDTAKDAGKTEKTDNRDRNRQPRQDGRTQNRQPRQDGRPDNRGDNRDSRGERRDGGRTYGQNRDGSTGRGPRQGTDGTRPSFRKDSPDGQRGGRGPQDGQRRYGSGQGRPGQGAPSGQDNAGRGNQNRGGASRPGSGRRNDAGFAPDLGKNSGKDSRRDRDRDNKNKKKDYEKTPGGRKPGQGGKGQNLPKALQKPVPHQKPEPKKPEVKEIILPEKMTIRELADAMKMQPSAIVKKLFLQGIMVTVNQEIDFEKAQEIALDFDIIAEKEEKVDVIEELLKEDEEDEADMVPRPPVVCVMGHVDHGKTSLLDAIRNTNVTRGEAGGITQHIGAYVVSIDGQRITFLDTPGHEAFTAMRMRGADATDIAVLVVAADDGVMPQTVEAISHAKAAGVEIIVAINKIDKPGANVERVKQELTEYELVPEDWGGSTVFVPVSAKTGEGIDSLLEMILLTAEVSELKANPKRAARGLVIEAQLDKGKGPVATILVQKGTLHVGDFIAAGACSGKVRAMMDDKGRRVKEAGPSTPVEILGLGDVPNAGEILMSFDSDKEAKNFAGTFVSENKNRLLEETKSKLSLDNLFDQIHASDLKELPLIVKADVQGSVEAVKQSLLKLSNEEVIVKVIHGGVGSINESDVSLASTSNAIIIGFNVRPDALAKQLAEQENVDMRLYKVIYQAIEDIESAMKGMLDPIFEEKIIGHAEVRQLFRASTVGTIAGSYVTDGVFQRGCKVRITREDEQVYEGELASLKRFKDDVKEVRAGFECGLVFKDFNDVKEEDKVEAYIMVEVPR